MSPHFPVQYFPILQNSDVKVLQFSCILSCTIEHNFEKTIYIYIIIIYHIYFFSFYIYFKRLFPNSFLIKVYPMAAINSGRKC